MSAVLVVPVAEDERYEWTRLAVESSGVGDAVLVLDEDAGVPWAAELGHVVRVEGFGIGKALDAGFRYALGLGAEWVVKCDAHVRFEEPLPPLLETYEPLKRYVLLPGIRPWGSGVVEWGVCLDYDTWEWRHWNYRPWRLLPHATEPVLVFHRSLVERLLSLQGRAFAVPYWGKESFDATLTLARMGHPVLAVPRPVVEHRYKQSWPEVRLRRRCTEPWCPELRPGESAYVASMGIGDAVYALRHYRRPELRRFWRSVERWVPVARRYFPEVARYLELRYTVEQVYGMWPPR